MDLVRYLLAMVVIVAHTDILAGYGTTVPLPSGDAVGGFFALSGFLMYPSYIKHRNFKRYTLGRARRILPPYFFIVLLCAFSLVAVSALSPAAYFTDRGFWQYIGANLSFLNWLHPSLPGVFTGAEYYVPAVNGSLWTMKVEWCLYFSVPLFVWVFTRLKLKKELTALLVIVLSMGYRWLFMYLHQSTGSAIYEILSRQIFGQLSFFYSGMMVYFYLDFFKKHLATFFTGGLCLYFIAHTSMAAEIFLAPPAFAIVVLAISLVPADLKILRHRHNISYDMYLFHYPIIQLSVYLGISTLGHAAELAIVTATTIALSYACNRLIDRRFYQKKVIFP